MLCTALALAALLAPHPIQQEIEIRGRAGFGITGCGTGSILDYPSWDVVPGNGTTTTWSYAASDASASIDASLVRWSGPGRDVLLMTLALSRCGNDSAWSGSGFRAWAPGGGGFIWLETPSGEGGVARVTVSGSADFGVSPYGPFGLDARVGFRTPQDHSHSTPTIDLMAAPSVSGSLAYRVPVEGTHSLDLSLGLTGRTQSGTTGSVTALIELYAEEEERFGSPCSPAWAEPPTLAVGGWKEPGQSITAVVTGEPGSIVYLVTGHERTALPALQSAACGLLLDHTTSIVGDVAVLEDGGQGVGEAGLFFDISPGALPGSTIDVQAVLRLPPPPASPGPYAPYVSPTASTDGVRLTVE